MCVNMSMLICMFMSVCGQRVHIHSISRIHSRSNTHTLSFGIGVAYANGQKIIELADGDHTATPAGTIVCVYCVDIHAILTHVGTSVCVCAMVLFLVWYWCKQTHNVYICVCVCSHS
jgi:hypothetical protein